MKYFAIAGLLLGTLFVSCKKESNKPTEQTPQPATLNLSGTYNWKFTIPSMGDQVSTLIFYADSVGYKMTGPAFTTDYNMSQVSYTELNGEKRWIGVGKGGSIAKDGIYFVMFFKDETASSVTVYKHECDKGLEDARSFAYPAADATADHGWNVYNKE